MRSQAHAGSICIIWDGGLQGKYTPMTKGGSRLLRQRIWENMSLTMIANTRKKRNSEPHQYLRNSPSRTAHARSEVLSGVARDVGLKEAPQIRISTRLGVSG